MKSIKILKTNVHLVTTELLFGHILNSIKFNNNLLIDYINIHSANLAYENDWFSNFLNSCDYVLCDGKGIQLAAAMLRKPIPRQLPYNIWLWDFFEFCSNNNISVFFLGSKPGIVDSAINKIFDQGANFRKSGHHGFFNMLGDDNRLVISKINAFCPDVLIIGFGMPLQEKWVLDNRNKLNAKVIILGGACLDWISGDITMPPKLVSRFGFEWFYRFLLDPKRLFKRYFLGIPIFAFRLIKSRFIY